MSWWQKPVGDKRTTDTGGWTSHGHPIPGRLIDPERRPSSVARCGGALLCGQCKREAGHFTSRKQDT